MEYLLELDKKLFLYINHGLEAEWLNQIMPTLTDLHKWDVFRFGVLPILLAIWFFSQRLYAVKVFLVIVLSVSLTDLLNYRVVKNLSHRDRPHVVEELGAQLRAHYGPKSSSFPSNHATNTATMATVLIYYHPIAGTVAWGLALLVGFSRVYLGVHYPGDVIFGWLMGLAIGVLLVRYCYSIWPITRARQKFVR